MNRRWKLIVSGASFWACIQSLEQDMMGKDKYIELVETAWVSPWVTVPMAVFGLFVVIAFWKRDSKENVDV